MRLHSSELADFLYPHLHGNSTAPKLTHLSHLRNLISIPSHQSRVHRQEKSRKVFRRPCSSQKAASTPASATRSARPQTPAASTHLALSPPPPPPPPHIPSPPGSGSPGRAPRPQQAQPRASRVAAAGQSRPHPAWPRRRRPGAPPAGRKAPRPRARRRPCPFPQRRPGPHLAFGGAAARGGRPRAAAAVGRAGSSGRSGRSGGVGGGAGSAGGRGSRGGAAAALLLPFLLVPLGEEVVEAPLLGLRHGGGGARCRS